MPGMDSIMPSMPQEVAYLSDSQLLGDVLSRPDVAMGMELSIPLQLMGLVAVNLAVVLALRGVLRNASDQAPISVVKVQVGLLKDHNELQKKLANLAGMIRLGQQGIWLVLEETILEISQHRSACAYAAVDVVPLGSKSDAIDLFSELAERNLGVAQREEAVASGSGSVQVAAAEDDASSDGGPIGMLQRMMGKPAREEAMVITLLVACRGALDVPQKMESWQDVQRSLTQLCGLSRDKLMAIELLWTPHDEGYYLTREQLEQDYTELQPIR